MIYLFLIICFLPFASCLLVLGSYYLFLVIWFLVLCIPSDFKLQYSDLVLHYH